MWGSWLVLVALCLTGADLRVNGHDTMGRLHWCNTLCMCHDDTRVEVQCFERSDIYELLRLNRLQLMKLEKANWELENHVLWCNDTCLCHQNQDRKIFKCVEDADVLHRFISDKIGDMYFYEEDEIASEREEEAEVEDVPNMDHRKRSEEKRKNRRNRKPKKRVKTPTTTPTPEVIEVETTSQTEVVLSSTPDDFMHSTPASEIRRTSGLSEHMTSSSEIIDTSFATESTHYEDEMMEDDDVGEYQEHEEAAEILPKQEAVAASPAVTAMQPPTRRQPFPPTVSSHAATREAETLTPKVSAVLEVPVQRKTVASEVSQDLDELGSAVMQIKSDVVLNQRILLVTVAVAGIAMLGVLVLAVHTCFASKRQSPPAQEKRPKDSSPNDDNHVTKVNLEEAW